MSDFTMGLDLGQANDYTALCALERIDRGPGEPAGHVRLARDMQREEAPDTVYHLRHLERFKLGTPYPAIVKRVTELLATPPLRGQAALVVDATGVGAAVVDLLRGAGLSPVAVTITAGERAERVDGGWRVPKRDLVGVLQVLFQGKRLLIAESLPEALTLTKELLSFQVKITAAAHDVYGAWREGAHDDLVLAVALACWYAERQGRVSLAGIEPPDAVDPWAKFR